MSVIGTGNFPKLLYPGLNTIYGLTYNTYPEEWKDLYEEDKSSKAFEEDMSVVSFGLVPVKNEGAGVTFDTERQGFVTRYVHTEYGLGFIITKTMFEDDQYDIVGKRKAKGLAFSVATTLNTLGVQPYINSTSYVGGDNVALLSASHPSPLTGSVQSNLSSSTLSESALESASIAIGKLNNDRGLRIYVQPQHLVIPIDLKFTAERILTSPLRVESMNNDPNALKEMGILPGGYKINHFLTQATSWYIKTNVPNGMKMYMRRSPEFTQDNDFDTDNGKYKVTFRCSFGWTDWRGLYGYDT